MVVPMTTTSPQSIEPVALAALELHALLVELQERKAHLASTAAPAERAGALGAKLAGLASQWRAGRPRLAELLQSAGERLRTVDLSRDGVGNNHRAASWKIAKYYEGLARLLRSEPDLPCALPELRPRNYARNAFHIGSGVGSAALATVWDDRLGLLCLALAWTGWMGGLEVVRRLNPRINRFLVDRVFGAIARPSEAWRINSATWYGLSIVIMLALRVPRAACIAAVLTLGLGDPVAALIGKRWGRHKLFGRKSVEGTLAFFAVASMAVLAWFLAFLPAEIAPGQGRAGAVPIALTCALVAGAAGALVEALSDRLEDNLTISLAVAGAVALCLP